MPDFDSKKQKVRRELERMGYRNIPEHQLNEFTTDLQRLMCHDRASRGSRSYTRSRTATSPSSHGRCRGGAGGGGGGSCADSGDLEDCPQRVTARSSQCCGGGPARPSSGRCGRPCSGGSGAVSSSLFAGCSSPCQSPSPPCQSPPRRRRAFRCDRGRRVEIDEGSLYSDPEFRDLRPEMASDGTPDECGNYCGGGGTCHDECDPCNPCDPCDPCNPCDPCDPCNPRDPCDPACMERAMCARPFPKLRVAPMVPPEMLCARPLARPGFRVNCNMLARPIRSDPCTRMKWYQDYWSTLKIPGIYKHHALCQAIRHMLDTYDYVPRPLNRREPVWNMSLLREQPTAMMRLNWC